MNAKTNSADYQNTSGANPQLTEFATHFLDTLSLLKEEKQKALSDHQMASRIDEAKFARIEANVIDIYEKMFQACLSKGNLGQAADWKSDLEKAYTHYLKTISANWYVNLAKCEQFHLEEEAHIERLKIDQMSAIQSHFLSSLEKA